MRLVIIYKSPIFHLRRERVDVINCTSTDQILEVLEKKLIHLDTKFVFRMIKDTTPLRLIKGWSLEHYEIDEGSEVEIDLMDNSEEEIIRLSKNIFTAANPGIKHHEIEDAGKQVFVDQGEETFNIRQYMDKECEKLLKQVQKNNLKQFLSILEDIPDIEEVSGHQIEKQKEKLINELGIGGWNSLHFAVYLNRKDFITEMLKRKVDFSKKTSDGWLPLQIAINRRIPQMIKFLTEQKSLNINAISARGSALHIAVQNCYIEGIKLLLAKNIDTKLVDQKNRTCLQLTTNTECISLVKQKEEKSQIRQICQEKQVIISLPFTVQIIKGYVYKVRSVLMNLSLRFMVLDPFEATLIRYENEESCPKKPLQVIPFANIKTVKIIKQKSWPMKKQYTYFQIYTPERIIMACKHQKIAQRWVKGIYDTVLFTVQVEKNKFLKDQIIRRTAILDDNKNQVIDTTNKVIPVSPTKSFAKKTNIFMSDNEQKMVKQTITSFVKPSEHKIDSELPNQPKIQNSTSQEKQVLIAPNISDITSIEMTEQQRKKPKFRNFDLLQVLGQGAFGTVFLVKHVLTSKIYALKALKKKTLIVKRQLKYAISEANVLKKTNHQFIINLHYAFQTPNFLYLVLDYCSGKDLNYHIQKQVTFSEQDTRFYIAELVLALEHLHKKDIIYRDMKPQNVLLDSEGHVKLADFGLSKDNFEEVSKSFCGSPAYLSPEMLLKKGVGKQADVYGLGCIMYECLVGLPPFYSDNIPKLYQDIKQGVLKYPGSISAEAKSLLKGLLERDPKKRLGSKSNYDGIKSHPFFSSIDWQALSNKKVEPPIRKQGQAKEDDSDAEQQDIIDKKKVLFTDCDYDQNTKKINRLINFSFIKEEE